MRIFGVVMAGGSGTRFWPLSRKKQPKQLLNLSGKDYMINEAVDRLATVTDYKNIFVVTNSTIAEKTFNTLNGRLERKMILDEPAIRNTAACIGFSAIEILEKYGDGVMVITPSDAYIKNADAFTKVLKTAISVADKEDVLVTVGIKPEFPATGYGYIKFSGDGEVKTVEKFVEKPNKETAERYLADGGYLWNSGMFIWKASVILDKIRTLLPEIYEKLQLIAKSFGKEDEREVVNSIYPTIPSISIDYGVMEHANDIRVIPADIGWSDVGDWNMLGVLNPLDENGNVRVGDTVCLDTKNSVIYAENKLVATIGLDDVIVVQTGDAILVCSREKAQEIKKISEKLSKENREDLT